MEQDFNQINNLEKFFICPITKNFFKNPVLASDGYSYEKIALIDLLENGNKKSPVTKINLEDRFYENIHLEKIIEEYFQSKKGINLDCPSVLKIDEDDKNIQSESVLLRRIESKIISESNSLTQEEKEKNNNESNEISQKYKEMKILYDKLILSYPKLDSDQIEYRDQIENYGEYKQYLGEWNKTTKVKHGRGVLFFSDDSKYEGYFIDDKANLKGKLLHANGDTYDGEWVNDKAEGFGVYHNDGSIYEGYWKQDKQEGKGKESWTDGASFEGDYKNGLKEGKGIFKWNDGSTYEGDFKDNITNGNGIYKWSEGRCYEGQWVNNKMEGNGKFVWADGRTYEGEYKNDKKEGFGKFCWSDGRCYEGFWKEGKQHGEGTYWSNNNEHKRKGVWVEGIRIRWIYDD